MLEPLGQWWWTWTSRLQHLAVSPWPWMRCLPWTTMWQGLGLQKRGGLWWAQGLLRQQPVSEAHTHHQELKASTLMPQVPAAA